ncbi:MAG: PD-(D/E)XK nuclease family protein [Candidatus Omnitrophica bacterium]|nr:PD-(D/E)XK nuclease family protein [Candidatus Omnitrophota bacterium]
MQRLITYNLSDNFIQKLGDYLEDNFLKKGASLDKLAIVFGGKRPALFLNRQLSERIKKSFIPPRYFSTDEFMEYTVNKICPYAMLPDLDASFMLYNLARKFSPQILKSRESFSQFLPWARQILAFIEQLDLEKISNEALANIKLKAQIGYDVPPAINQLLEDLAVLRQNFHLAMKEKNSFLRGFVYFLASEYIKKTDFPEFERIIFCNLFFMPKAEEEVVQHLYNGEKALIFLQGRQDRWPVLKRLSGVFSAKIAPPQPKEPDYKLHIYSGFDTQSQAALVRKALSQIKTTQNTVIVMPQEENILPLLAEISQDIKEVNVSLGYPVRQSSLYSLFETIFQAQNSQKEDAYYAKDYLRVLMHPLVKNLRFTDDFSLTRVFIHKIEEFLVGAIENELAASLFIKLKEIEELESLYIYVEKTLKNMDIAVKREHLKDIIRQIHGLFFYSWENTNTSFDFSVSLEAVCRCLLEKNSFNNYPLNLKVMEKIISVKNDFKNAVFSKEKFPKEEIFKVFKEKLENSVVSFSGSPLKGLQILGLWETRSLNFENVIIMDVNETVLPKLQIYEPLVPRDVTVSLGIDRLEKDEEMQRYQFYRLISSAKNVYLIYEESKDKEKSRFIEELIWGRQKEKNSLEVISIPRASFKVKVLQKKLKFEKNKKILDFLKSMTYSATRVDTYLSCPLKFYYRYVLGLEEKEKLAEDPEGSDIGNFMHSLLEEAFRGFLKRKPVIDDKFRDYFFKTLDKRFKETFHNRMKSDAFMLKAVVDERMERFLDEEEKRNVSQILELEVQRNYILNSGKKEFKFTAKIDRIDRLSDDSLLVIDYKSGSQDPMPAKSLDKLKIGAFSRQSIKQIVKSFQLPIYYYCLENIYPHSRINIALYYLRTTKLDSYDEDLNKVSENMLLLKEPLGFIISQIQDPQVCFEADDTDPRLCDYCPYFYLCR